MNTTSVLQQFRQSVYQILPKRADAMVDLVDALTVAGHVDSPVALSEEAPYRRKFSSIYDTLGEGRIVNSRGMRATRSRAYGARELSLIHI